MKLLYLREINKFEAWELLKYEKFIMIIWDPKNSSEKNFVVEYFESNEDINEYTWKSDYGLNWNTKPLCFAIAIENQTNGYYSYRLRYNASGNVLKSEIPPAEYPPEIHPTKK
jgi:hypothetical protein